MAIDDRNFSTADFPVDASAHRAWQIMRTPTRGPLQMVVVSRLHVGFNTHHHCGRTVPHLNADCFPCSRHMAWRWTGYLLAKEVSKGQRILFEFPEMAGVDLREILQTYSDLRGLALQSIRPSGRPNGRVVLTTKGMFSKAIDLPADEPIKPIVYHIWGLRESAPVAIDNQVDAPLTESQKSRKKAKLSPPGGKPKLPLEIVDDLPGQRHLALDGPVRFVDFLPDIISHVESNGSTKNPRNGG